MVSSWALLGYLAYGATLGSLVGAAGPWAPIRAPTPHVHHAPHTAGNLLSSPEWQRGA
jgi:hypothetical protein